jgi:hypothetical protein
MSHVKHTLAVLFSIGLAYIWLTVPVLANYSLQAFALATIGFFLSKRFSRAQIWHIMPETHSFEIVFISFAITLLIGATGNAESIFYPFAYIHLFFLVMTTRQTTAITATMAILVVHYALQPEINSATIATLTTLPLMLIFFLFARRQYDDARLQLKLAQAEEDALEDLTEKELSLEGFIINFLQPKLAIITDLLETSIHRRESVDPEIVKTQVSLLASESKKVITKLHSPDKNQSSNTTKPD